VAEITLVIGADASWAGQQRGKIRSVVVSRDAGSVTHLMVEPDGRQGLGRLVPFELADAATGDIWLRCTEEEFEKLPSAEETGFVPGTVGFGNSGPAQLLPENWSAAEDSHVDGAGIPGTSQTETVDIVPDLIGEQESEVQRGEHVHATDGDVGRLYGFSIDPGTGQVTHLLLKEHLPAGKTVAIPFAKVAQFDDGIQLSITRQEVKDLPAAGR
jgi:sporulation protein YlmC with PRC-barrel domain